LVEADERTSKVDDSKVDAPTSALAREPRREMEESQLSEPSPKPQFDLPAH
jgi:hypothetical protein